MNLPPYKLLEHFFLIEQFFLGKTLNEPSYLQVIRKHIKHILIRDIKEFFLKNQKQNQISQKIHSAMCWKHGKGCFITP
jgi:hypothetical protein